MGGVSLHPVPGARPDRPQRLKPQDLQPPVHPSEPGLPPRGRAAAGLSGTHRPSTAPTGNSLERHATDNSVRRQCKNIHCEVRDKSYTFCSQALESSGCNVNVSSERERERERER